MKKMNLIFLSFKPKIVITLFLLFGVMMITSSKISAQYVSQTDAVKIVARHISELPPVDLNFATANRANSVTNSSISDSELNFLDHRFGKLLEHYISDESKTVADAMNLTYQSLSKKTSKAVADRLKKDYDLLLAKD